MRGRHDDPVRQSRITTRIVRQDGTRDDWRGRVSSALLDLQLDPVGGEDLEGGGEGRFRQRVGVDADQERAVDAVGRTNLGDRLAHCGDVVVIEGPVRGRAAVARRAERHALAGLPGIRLDGEVGGYETRYVYEKLGRCRLTG